MASQTSSTGALREASNLKAMARPTLRDDLDAIARTARAWAITTKGLENMFRMLHSGGDAALLNSARSDC